MGDYEELKIVSIMLYLTQTAWRNLKRGKMFLIFSANKVQIFSC